MSEDELFEGLSRAEVHKETAFDYRLCRLISAKTGEAHELDHIVPVSKGGAHRLHNLRIITRFENRSQHDSWLYAEYNSGLTDADIDRLDDIPF